MFRSGKVSPGQGAAVTPDVGATGSERQKPMAESGRKIYCARLNDDERGFLREIVDGGKVLVAQRCKRAQFRLRAD